MPPADRFHKSGLIAAALLALAMAACRQEIVPEPYLPSSAHEAYRHGLRQAGLADTALGRDWLAAAEQALQTTVKIKPPFTEVRHVSAAEAFAVAYEFEAQRGQRIEVAVTFQGEQQTRLFVDLFRINGPDREKWVAVASADEGEGRLEMEPRRTGGYVVRLQSELLRGGRCQITIRKVPTLKFPVAGKDARAIGSPFGAPRDGGRRRHQGVDIFAARHTPVLSPTRTYVHHVGTNRLGGRCIWLYDQKRAHYYYLAHLESYKAEENTWVDEGETVATVGNSGNARTTPPHLHFAVWSRLAGWLDPQPFLGGTRSAPPPITGNTDLLGRWIQARSHHDVRLSTGDSPAADLSPMLVLAAVADRYRVRLADGSTGTVASTRIEVASAPASSEYQQ